MERYDEEHDDFKNRNEEDEVDDFDLIDDDFDYEDEDLEMLDKDYEIPEHKRRNRNIPGIERKDGWSLLVGHCLLDTACWTLLAIQTDRVYIYVF